jgi:hypothetical protein
VNLTYVSFSLLYHLTKVKFSNCPQLKTLGFVGLKQLQKIEGLEELDKLIYLAIGQCPELSAPYSFLTE